MKKVLYFYPTYSSFVASDFRLLAKSYAVHKYLFRASRKIFTPYCFVHQFFFILFHLPSSRFFVSQFSGYHSFLPSLFGKLFNRPHYIVLHGTECNNFPEYHYGFKMRPLLFWFSEKSMSLATRLLPVSESLIEQDYSYADTTYKKQGLRAFYPDMDTPVTVIYNGTSPGEFDLIPEIKRVPNSFITVATGLDDRNRRMLKGLDFICLLAGRFPDYTFTFIGGNQDPSFKIPSNIKLIGHIPNDELKNIYNEHQFYLQLSMSEGFGISVVEAMMCGCIPIVSHVGILPKIVGSFGYVLLKKELDLAEQLVQHALLHSISTDLNEMRRWAIDHYALDRREKALSAILAPL